MAVIDINSSYIKESGYDMIGLTNEIKEIIDDTFSMIANMSMETGAWQGKAAEEFVLASKIDKSNYIKLNQSINNFGKYLIEYANSMESLISRVKNL